LYKEIDGKLKDTAFRSLPENEFKIQKLIEQLYLKAVEFPNKTWEAAVRFEY
jgi:hypothetical protein